MIETHGIRKHIEPSELDQHGVVAVEAEAELVYADWIEESNNAGHVFPCVAGFDREDAKAVSSGEHPVEKEPV